MPSDVEQRSMAANMSTHEEAIALLRSRSPHERLRGARFFAKNAREKDIVQLKHLRNSETDSYVIRTLNLAIDRSSPSIAESAELPTDKATEELHRRSRIDAIEWIAGLLLHEIASPIGLIAEAAQREVPQYETTQLKLRIENLQRIFEGIEKFKNAAGTPNIQQFDLTTWLEAVIEDDRTVA
jgi:hypothetical protein